MAIAEYPRAATIPWATMLTNQLKRGKKLRTVMTPHLMPLASSSSRSRLEFTSALEDRSGKADQPRAASIPALKARPKPPLPISTTSATSKSSNTFRLLAARCVVLLESDRDGLSCSENLVCGESIWLAICSLLGIDLQNLVFTMPSCNALYIIQMGSSFASVWLDAYGWFPARADR